MISLYGDKDGRKRHSELMYKLKHKNTIYYYIDKFWSHDGQQRYFAKNYKNDESIRFVKLNFFVPTQHKPRGHVVLFFYIEKA